MNTVTLIYCLVFVSLHLLWYFLIKSIIWLSGWGVGQRPWVISIWKLPLYTMYGNPLRAGGNAHSHWEVAPRIQFLSHLSDLASVVRSQAREKHPVT